MTSAQKFASGWRCLTASMKRECMLWSYPGAGGERSASGSTQVSGSAADLLDKKFDVVVDREVNHGRHRAPGIVGCAVGGGRNSQPVGRSVLVDCTDDQIAGAGCYEQVR